MFVLGIGACLLVVGVVVAAIWLVNRQASSPAATSYRAQSAIRDIERQTINAMLAAELNAQRAAVEAKHRHGELP